MNIGKWIIVAFVLFAAFIATLVTVCMKQDISLVSKDYYKDELRYEGQIKRINNTTALKEKPVLSLSNHSLHIAFGSVSSIDEGKLELFCPSNSKMDKRFDLQTDSADQKFDVSNLSRGMYRAKLTWSMNGKDFYHEEVIYL